jgi:hypothetical protein
MSIERADQGGSNGGRIMWIGCVLREIWCFEKRSGKYIYFLKKNW